MKLDDVLALIRAGYTREEIAAFETHAPSVPENKPTPVPNEQPAPENKPTPVHNAHPAPDNKPTSAPNSLPQPQAPADLKAIITQAVKEAMQAQAIATSNQPNNSTQTAEECLAAMLR